MNRIITILSVILLILAAVFYFVGIASGSLILLAILGALAVGIGVLSNM